MKKYKKIIFEIDNKNNHRFLHVDVSEDEVKLINNGYLNKDGKLKPEKKMIKNKMKIVIPDYVNLSEVYNISRFGDVNKWGKIIYFKDDDKEKTLAVRKITNAFFNIFGGRDKASLQNLTYLTKENIDFANKIKQEYFPIKFVNNEKKENKKGKTEK